MSSLRPPSLLDGPHSAPAYQSSSSSFLLAPSVSLSAPSTPLSSLSPSVLLAVPGSQFKHSKRPARSSLLLCLRWVGSFLLLLFVLFSLAVLTFSLANSRSLSETLLLLFPRAQEHLKLPALPHHPIPQASPSPSPSSPSSVQSYLEQFKRAFSPRLCAGNRTEVERDFQLSAELEQREQEERVLRFTITRLCVPALDAPAPRVYFRVHSTGSSLTAVGPALTVMHAGQHVVRGSVRVPDAGHVELHCKVMSYNLSDASMLQADYKKYEVLPHSPERLWRERPVRLSPVSFELPELSQGTQAGLPLCFSDLSVNSTLAGRWHSGSQLGAFRPGKYPDMFDLHPAAQWRPFDCRLDDSDPQFNFSHAVRQLRWFHLVGDSNGRHAFDTWCRLLAGEAHEGTREPPVGQWDLPKLCLLDGGTTVFTYSHWLVHKAFVLRPQLSFGQQCALYTEDKSKIEQQGTMFGWADCQLAAPAIQQMTAPGLTYFMWGSHGAELGDNTRTWLYLSEMFFAHEWFKSHPSLIAFVPDVDASQEPDKFGAQFIYRNNERIERQNALISAAVRRNWADWPMLYEDALGNELRGLNPLWDVFSPSHAASEMLHPDAVHFVERFELQLARWIAHWVKHAPQTNAQLRRKRAPDTTRTTTKMEFIL